MFFLDNDIIHEILFELFKGFEVQGSLLQTGFAEIVVLGESESTRELLLPLSLFLQLRK